MRLCEGARHQQLAEGGSDIEVFVRLARPLEGGDDILPGKETAPEGCLCRRQYADLDTQLRPGDQRALCDGLEAALAGVKLWSVGAP